MKKILFLAAFLVSIAMSAQAVKPKFEKEGDKVKATYFHANGEVSQQGYFLNEKLTGEWTMYNTQGEKIAMGNYVEGVKTGKWLFWEGETIKEVDFNNNRIAAVVDAKTKESLVKN
ncbi:toxin-antitoxin system YwqK family antitoxin [Maribacter sp. 2210JD10-5]|uniref:toxin-antitoxin system YwqK family antitoxin n=1 Tax=Maribacter sp. 2210JD10-5 TaxID=3386272 RepID=UPI0039BC5A61